MLAGVCARRNRAPRARRTLARTFAVLALVSLSAVVDPGIVRSAAAETGPIGLTVAAVQSSVAPGSIMTLSAEVLADTELPAATLGVALSATPLGSESAIASWLRGEAAPGPVAANTAVPAVAAGGRALSTVTIAAPAGSGVWGVAATWSDGAAALSARSVVTVLGPQAPADVFALWPLTVPAESGGLLSPSELAELTAPTGALSRQLDAVVGRTVTVGIDPRIIASIRSLGASAPESARDWLARLRTVSLDSFPLQFADADPAVQVQAGLESLLAPGQIAQPASAESPPNYSRSDVAWPALGTVAAGDMAVFAESGLDVTVLSSSNVSAGPWVAIETGRAIVADDIISASFTAAVAAPSQTSFDAAIAETVARLSLRPGQTVVVAPDRVIPELSERLSLAFEAISNGTSRLLPVSALTAREPLAASFEPSPESSERVASVQAMLQTEPSVAAFSRVAVSPGTVVDEHRRALLAALSLSWLAPGQDWTVASREFQAETAALLDSVRVSSSSTVNILASEASLPLSIENALTQPVIVQVLVAPSNGRLVVAERVTTQLDANSRATVRVPVEARIGNGNVLLRVSLSAADGTPIGSPTVIRANVQADWEGWGAGVLGILAASLFAIGLVRQVRRSRRTALTTDAASDE